MFSEKQSKEFVDWYKNRYKWFDEPINHTSKEMLGIDTDVDRIEWSKFIKWLLGDKAYSIYKRRRTCAVTYLEAALDSLWFNYWPKE